MNISKYSLQANDRKHNIRKHHISKTVGEEERTQREQYRASENRR